METNLQNLRPKRIESEEYLLHKEKQIDLQTCHQAILKILKVPKLSSVKKYINLFDFSNGLLIFSIHNSRPMYIGILATKAFSCWTLMHVA